MMESDAIATTSAMVRPPYKSWVTRHSNLVLVANRDVDHSTEADPLASEAQVLVPVIPGIAHQLTVQDDFPQLRVEHLAEFCPEGVRVASLGMGQAGVEVLVARDHVVAACHLAAARLTHVRPVVLESRG